MPDLTPHLGSRHTWRCPVRREHTVPALPLDVPMLAGMPEVLATPMLVAMAECAAAAHLAALLGPDTLSLGAEVQITHEAPTPVGLTMTVTTELVAAEGRLVTFAFTAHDGVEQAGNGRHTRALVGQERLAHILAAKRARAG